MDQAAKSDHRYLVMNEAGWLELGTKENHNLVFLPYHPGKRTEEVLNGKPIISGPFSGCWATSTTKAHSTTVYHIGTRENLDEFKEKNRQLKVDFNKMIEADSLTDSVRGVNPWLQISPERRFEIVLNRDRAQLWAFVDVDGRTHAFEMWRHGEENYKARLVTPLEFKVSGGPIPENGQTDEEKREETRQMEAWVKSREERRGTPQKEQEKQRTTLIECITIGWNCFRPGRK